MRRFRDRKKELDALQNRLRRPASFGLVYGPRRVGKTRLLQRLVEDRDDAIFFIADESTRTSLLARFHDVVQGSGFGGPTWPDVAQADWGTSLTLLLQSAVSAGRSLVLVLDEVQYLIAADPALPSILQRLWDELHAHSALHIILCGSALGTLAQLGGAGQPLHGRFDLQMKLAPFDYRQAAEFAPGWSRVDQLLLYGVFGGLARHLAEVDPERALADNAVDAIIDPLAPLHDAPLDILRTEHLSAHPEAHAVLASVAAGENRFGPIAARTGLKGPRAAYVLEELQALEIIERQVRHGDKPGARFARYVCCDPLVRFWFRHIPANRVALLSTDPHEIWQNEMAPCLDDHMGAVFEAVVRQALQSGTLGLRSHHPPRPYWSRDGQTEIDHVVQTDEGRVFVECKWRPNGRVGVADLGRLRGHIARSGGASEDDRACLVTAGAFTEELRTVAEADGTLLFGLDDLF